MARRQASMTAAQAKDLAARLEPEEAFMRRIMDLAKQAGWWCYHARSARTAKGWRTPVSGDGAGFPDLLLSRGRRLVLIECKVVGGKPTTEQKTWMEKLKETGAECFCLSPKDWEKIEVLLA